MSRLLQGKTKTVFLIPPTNFTTATDGQNTAIDTKGWREGMVLAPCGAMSNVNLNIDIQHSDEAAANFATIPAPTGSTRINPRLLALTNAQVNGGVVAYLNFEAGIKRYIKPIDTLNANSAIYGLIVVLFNPKDSTAAETYQADGT